MAGKYEEAISIQEAIDAINHRDYLLPAIQRKFVWSSHQICVLFDSIMRGYPINTFMMWEVKDSSIKNNHKFYDFLKDYCQRFNEENSTHKTSASDQDFKAIIDGQQRLTSLYIGLCGTYAYKKPRVWWPSARDEEALPRRKLYLDLKKRVSSDENDSLMKYHFQFLTDKQYQSSLSKTEDHHWFCLHRVLEFPSVNGTNHILDEVVMPFLESVGLSDNEFAQDTLSQLYGVIRTQKIIHYFNESSQEVDDVLDVFIRTNSGGTQLAFSDLLMSFAVAHWDGDFRKEIDDLIKNIHQSGSMGFYIERDWILKTCLMLIDVDVRFKVKNFKAEQVEKIQTEWQSIKDCIKASFQLVKQFGINEQSLTSKNAVIPICYYLYKENENDYPLYNDINNLSKCVEQRSKISQWFYTALLKGVFGGQSDTFLTGMRDVLRDNIGKATFPLESIVNQYKASNKDLRFDDAYIESLLDIQYGEGRCRALLHLLFSEMDSTKVFHIDHLHPRSAFEEKSLDSHEFLQNDKKRYDFFNDQKKWNSIANLHLLDPSLNSSKYNKPLSEWINDPNINLQANDLLVDKNILEFDEFQQFYEQRRAKLKQKLVSKVFMSEQAQSILTAEDSDEEMIEG